MNALSELLEFLKNPRLERDCDSTFYTRAVKCVQLLLTCFAISFLISFAIGALYQTKLIENQYHAFDTIKDLPSSTILVLVAIIAPIVEETVFRAPLVLFKKPYFFKIAFYSLALIFGYVHLFNYDINHQILLFSPILVAPQILLGLIFGFVRVRFGLLWAMAMHAAYNGLLVSLFLFASNAIQ